MDNFKESQPSSGKLESDKPERPEKPSAKHRTRDLILQAAERAFGDSGMKGATTKEIAKAAGINETTLFRHFPSKEALLMAVIQAGMQETEEQFRSELKFCGNLADDLLYFSGIYCRHIQKKEPMIRVCLSTMNHMPEEAKELFKVTNLPTVRHLAACLSAAQNAGQMRPELDCYQVAQAFLSILMMSVLKQNVLERHYTQAEYLQTVIDLFVNGIKTSPDLKGIAS